jgi:hypothetical protein
MRIHIYSHVNEIVLNIEDYWNYVMMIVMVMA